MCSPKEYAKLYAEAWRLAYYDLVESGEDKKIQLIEEYPDPDRNEIIYSEN